MKNSIHTLTIILFLIHILGNAQSNFDNYYYYPGHNNMSTRFVKHTPDSGAVLAGAIQDNVSNFYKLGLTKLDKDGNVTIQKIYGLPGKDLTVPSIGIKYFIPATSCSYFYAGGYYNSDTISSIIIYKINRQSLDTIRTALYEDTCHVSFGNIVKLHDNKYFLIGEKSTNTTSTRFILHLDSNLQVVNKINVYTPNDFFINNAVYNPDRKLILLEGYDYNTGTGFFVPATFMHIDTLGNPVSAVTVTASPYGYGRGVHQVFYSHTDSSYVLTGYKVTNIISMGTGTPNYKRLMIGKLDAGTLSPRWHKLYGGESYAPYLLDAVIAGNGDITACGAYSKFATAQIYEDYGGAMIKTDKDGNLQCFSVFNNMVVDSSVLLPTPATYPYPYNQWEDFGGIDTTADGHYILSGNVLYQPMGWVVKTSSLACEPNINVQNITVTSQTISVTPPPTQTTGIVSNEMQRNNVHVYPNPCKDIVNIQVDNVYEGMDLKITDISGRVLKQIPLNGNNKVDLSSLSAGIYFFRVAVNGRLVITEKVIKE